MAKQVCNCFIEVTTNVEVWHFLLGMTLLNKIVKKIANNWLNLTTTIDGQSAKT